jgi:hypothetical protein
VSGRPESSQEWNQDGGRYLGQGLPIRSAYNRHLSDVIERLPETASSASCNIGQAEPVPLEFVVKDYLRHVRHHLNDILDKDR